MITDTFEHIRDEGDECSVMKCNECQEMFTANFNMLLPEHVEYELGTNMKMTVTCPYCNAKAKVSQQEYKLSTGLAELETKRDLLVAELRKRLKDIDIKFMIKGDRYGQGFAIFDCLVCGTEFEARTGTHPDGRLNVRVDKNNFALVCPNCGVEDEINKNNVNQRGEISVLNQIIRGFNERISELKSELEACAEPNDG